MTRAAHTLGGIAATVGLMPLHHLAITLEHALLRRDSSGRPESIGGLESVRQAIITLEQMFAGLARQEAPGEQVQLIAALEDVFLIEPQAVELASEMPEPAAEEEVVSLVEPAAQPAVETAVPATAVPAARLKDDLDEQLLPIFLEEAQDQLRELTLQLRLWRGDLASDAQPHAIARLLHTFKGNARMAGAMNLGEWGDRSLRGVLLGTPPLLITQRLLGGSRPGENREASEWQPFEDNNAVSGHAFMGAIPFLTAMQMTDD